MVFRKCQDTNSFESLLSMANITFPGQAPVERELSSATPSLTNEDEKALELAGNIAVGQNDEKEVAVLDDAGIKSPSYPNEPPETHRDGGGDGAELPPEPAVEQPRPAGKAYSILTVTQKRAIILAASFASLFSPMATAIYCELLAKLL